MMRLWVENGLLMICILRTISKLTTASSFSAHVQIPLQNRRNAGKPIIR